MDIEFHYHITYILARKGGYSEEDASTIAYACQYTDDNNDKYEVILEDGSVYGNYISQTLNILRPKNKLVRIYTCFHFFPGEYWSDDAQRADCSLHLFNTTSDSPDAQTMFRTALEATGWPRVIKHKGPFARWDALAIDGPIVAMYEIKTDFHYVERDTGNVAIEHTYKGEPSGISNTEANFWVEIIPWQQVPVAYIVPVEALRAFIKSKPRIKSIPMGNNAEGYLLDFASEYLALDGIRTLMLYGDTSYYIDAKPYVGPDVVSPHTAMLEEFKSRQGRWNA